ncbi:hypothetical protein CHUAL_012951 [Chamberlinius hualienensis]
MKIFLVLLIVCSLMLATMAYPDPEPVPIADPEAYPDADPQYGGGYRYSYGGYRGGYGGGSRYRGGGSRRYWG